ncbi:MAG: anti-sigma factor antagonist, partial [Clostridia bacterium]|nr:anti-sigma factor antagonist [Clostridia bacterium]
MKHEYSDGILKIYLEGRVDAYTSVKTEEEIFKAYNETTPEKAVIDCTDLEYIASAGLRILLKLGKNCEMSIVNVSRDVYELLDMTGFTGMFDTKRIMRQVSVEECKVIGTGFSSKVYRIDKETVVKVYEGKVTLERIYNETASAKKSFVSGIPTAIPYDVVRCGDAYGTVFELKKFHSTPSLSVTFPYIHDKYHSCAAGLKKYLTEDEAAGINRMIDAIPDCQKMIHVDCHSGNIMSQNGKLTFVDMADVSIGHPLVDIGSEYFH